MAQASKTFRIFVSSTFSDLKEERNALQKEVFPKLRELCMQHGCRFQAIDLRWGVREEAALDQQTMKICLEEIARCQRVTPRPNFIVLLGDRYGWRPLPAEIPADEFEEILRCLPTDETEKQCRHTLLNQWYRRDDNAVPPVYCLLPREGEFKDFDKWEVVERELRSILLEAIDEMLLEPEKRLKYTASATEQEIAKAVLRVPDAQEHVFCFFRIIKNLPLDESARDFVDLVEVNGAYQPDTEARDRLERLKNRELRERLPGNIYDYEAEWTGSGITTDHLAKLCEDVYQSLSHIIEREIAQLEEVGPLEKEKADHETFGKERAKFFVGRAGILQTIGDYVKRGDRHPLAVYGASGSGKSALMARAVEQAHNAHPDAEIVVHFIGATPGSSDSRALLESLCREISRRYGADETTIPMDYRELVQEFPKRLALAAADKPLIVFIDALDQLRDFEHARNLAWLPADLPENVRLIVSTLPGECLTALERKRPRPNLVELEPMSPAEGSDLLDLWLKDAGRTLQDDQRAEVLGKFAQNGLPLYLKLAFEEARRWKSYTTDIVLKPDIPGVIRNLFARLSSDANHGPTLVSRSLGYLAVAKNGLSEDELLDVLSFDKEVFQDFMKRAHHEPPEQRLPVVVWSRLYFDLEPYLTERTADGASLMAFYHRQLGEVVMEDYLAGEAKQGRHCGLARYFAEQALQIEKDGKKTPNLRKVSELPYQQTQGQMWDKLEQTLTDLNFVETKCVAATVFDALRDFLAALAEMPQDYSGRAAISALHRAIDADSHVLEEDPLRLVQEVYNALVWDWDETTVLGRAIREVAERCNQPWLKRLNRPTATTDPVLLRRLVGHDRVSSVAFSPDGKTLASGSEDGMVKLWDAQTGQEMWTLTHSSAVVTSVTFTPDGKTLASGNIDGTVKLWDAQTGQEMWTLEGHGRAVISVTFTSDGKTLASGSEDGTVKLWDARTGALQRTLTHSKSDPMGAVDSVTFTSDGKTLASGSRDGTVTLWDARTGALQRTLRPYGGPMVFSVTFAPDGKTLASGSDGGTVTLWNAQARQDVAPMQTLKGHHDYVTSVAFVPDGKTLASGSRDGTVTLWDAPGKLLAWLSCIDRVKALWFDPVLPQLRVADAGGAAHVPNIYLLEIVQPQR